MKKIFGVILAVFLIVSMVSCSGVQVNPSSNSACMAAGNAAGMIIADKNPAMAKTILPFANGLLQMAQAGTMDQSTLMAAINSMMTQAGADLELKLAVDVALSMVTIQVTAGTVNPQVVALLQGFVTGITPPTAMQRLFRLKR